MGVRIRRARGRMPKVGGDAYARRSRGAWYDFFTRPSGTTMATSVKRTISLPADLAREVEALAKAEGKTVSAVIQDALRHTHVERRRAELRGLQGYWSRRAHERGVLTQRDLERYLRA